MKILLVYPKLPTDFWSFKHALKFISKKAVLPPIGLLTVAAMLPAEWEKKLVDMNIKDLKESDIKWADLVFLSAMSVQEKGVIEIISRCKKAGVKIVAGGPLFTSTHEKFDNIEHLVLNEAEITLPLFLEDLKNNCAKHIYQSSEWADLKKTPAPLWGLIEMKKYNTTGIQYSRGCPFDCDFCDITMLYGRKSRTKSREQVIAELDNLYSRGWRDTIFFVDDNFIGNKQELKKEILPAMINWMEEKDFPFEFITQASINISDDEDLMDLMVTAGFRTLFIGIETPNEGSLAECSKFQNKNRDLVESIKKIQRFGFEVQGGFIVGFDNDPASIFERQIQFIQKSGIVTALVNVLKAPRGTKLYQRLKSENRLMKDFEGSSWATNFIPKMGHEALINGYKKLVTKIYSPKLFYARIKNHLRELKECGQAKKVQFKIHLVHFKALLKIVFQFGIIRKGRFHYWNLFFWTLFKCPRQLPHALSLVVQGFSIRKTFEEAL